MTVERLWERGQLEAMTSRARRLVPTHAADAVVDAALGLVKSAHMAA